MTHFNLVVRLTLISFMVFNLSGCDQFRSKLADLIAPQSPEDGLKSIDAMIANGQLKEALAKAESFIEKSGDLRGQFELAAARVAALQGNVDIALRYLAQAIVSLNISAQQLMNDEVFSPMHTDTRFLQLLTKQVKSGPPDLMSKPDSHVKASEDTQIKITNKGTEVRAGDIVIKLPN